MQGPITNIYYECPVCKVVCAVKLAQDLEDASMSINFGPRVPFKFLGSPYAEFDCGHKVGFKKARFEDEALTKLISIEF